MPGGHWIKLCAAIAGAGVWLAAASASHAEPDLISREAFTGLLDVRAAVVDGERSWLDDGFGKLRYGGKGDGFEGRASLADAALAWKPRLTWDLSAVVDGEVQHEQGYRADLIQAYLAYKPVPHGPLRYSLRAGLYYPEVSQEHSGPLWEDVDMLTPSAIDTWIGEEAKVVGGEASLTRAFGEHEISATVGAFGYGDTSGTLLTFRGWAMGDIKAGAFGDFTLPPLERLYLIGQPPETYSLREIDSRVGYYGRLEWRPPGRVRVNAFYYDNRGDLVGVDRDHQWAWATRFTNLGASWSPDEHTRILSQVMWGDTRMGFPTPRGVWFDVAFASAYALVSRDVGPGALSGRVDYFETTDRNFRPGVDETDHDWGETGWALTADYRWTLTPWANLLFEVAHVESNRPSRLEAGLDRFQTQTLVQSALRLSF
jgi:hypothetical protein